MQESSAKKDKIFAEHPRGKKGVWIDAVKYNLMKNDITKFLKGRELTHAELFYFRECKKVSGYFPDPCLGIWRR